MAGWIEIDNDGGIDTLDNIDRCGWMERQIPRLIDKVRDGWVDG